MDNLEAQFNSPSNQIQDSLPTSTPKKKPVVIFSEDSAYTGKKKPKIVVIQEPMEPDTVVTADQTVKPETIESAAIEEAPLLVGDSDITSYENIELATRYIVYFDFNRSSIPTQYKSLLKAIRDKMLLAENNFLKITGYADSQGNKNYNYSLSLNRAEKVKEFFTLRGIAEDRLQVSAVGSVKRGENWLESIEARKEIGG
jgi:outer membrane protein OmpA-like peptidoglycan-associated protein